MRPTVKPEFRAGASLRNARRQAGAPTPLRTDGLSCGSQPGTVYVSALSPDEGNLQIFYYDLRKYN